MYRTDLDFALWGCDDAFDLEKEFWTVPENDIEWLAVPELVQTLCRCISTCMDGKAITIKGALA